MTGFCEILRMTHMCMDRFSVASSMASLIASAYVGCACDILAISSALARYSNATTASAIKSAAPPTSDKQKIPNGRVQLSSKCSRE